MRVTYIIHLSSYNKHKHKLLLSDLVVFWDTYLDSLSLCGCEQRERERGSYYKVCTCC